MRKWWREVSKSLRQEVFQEYGIVNAHASDYEIDYLIAPGLGGAEDIRNLWPEPYTARTWNAHVKDALEERLHEMVCAGELDLSTAQRDIATDWIAAYKKYFHTDRPLSLHSRSDSSSDFRELTPRSAWLLVADHCGAGEPTHFDVPHRRLTEEALVLAVELTRTLIADFGRRARGIDPFNRHSFSRGN